MEINIPPTRKSSIFPYIYRCSRCRIIYNDVPADKCYQMYDKLKKFLAVERSWGCYTPPRIYPSKKAPVIPIFTKNGDHSIWPLHYWEGPGTFPLVLKWTPKSDKRPTFRQFCRAYGINPVAEQ